MWFLSPFLPVQLSSPLTAITVAPNLNRSNSNFVPQLLPLIAIAARHFFTATSPPLARIESPNLPSWFPFFSPLVLLFLLHQCNTAQNHRRQPKKEGESNSEWLAHILQINRVVVVLPTRRLSRRPPQPNHYHRPRYFPLATFLVAISSTFAEIGVWPLSKCCKQSSSNNSTLQQLLVGLPN